MHKDSITGLQPETIEQLDRGRAGPWNRGRFDHIKRRRARTNPTRIEIDVIGVRTPAGAANRTHAPDRVSAREPRNARPDLLDPARALITDHVRRRDPGPTRVGPIGRIDRIHSDRSDPNEHAP